MKLPGVSLPLTAALAFTLLQPRALPAQQGTDAVLERRITAAAALPALADQVRGAGVAVHDLSALLEAFGAARVPATEASVILNEEWTAAREHGPVPGMGSFVQARLAEGLRGRDLAAAIRREHVTRGKGGDGMGPPGRGQAERRPARVPR